ncbi:PREDICTED: MICOS complex subunit MIC13-like [Eufriesea mexicana]|uniref:MICOS complex subunit MIC13-like n=1 Tax=Eufriesea mexicana TaxID=516756 RepID=UPI00083C5C7C|nr:PREDICTED: MICOS complex subunit MIC13-like [Eufriesea mexicana]
MKIPWFLVKATVVGNVVYYTYAEGLWSKPEETAKLYKKICVNVAPYVKENVPKEIIEEIAQLPSVTDITSFIKTSWNQGVMTSMEFLSDLPTYTYNSSISLYEIMQKYLKDIPS